MAPARQPVTVAFGLDYKVPDASSTGRRPPMSAAPQPPPTAAAGARAAAAGAGAGAAAARRRLGRGLERRAREHCDSGRAPVGAHPDLRIPGDAGALSPCPPGRAHWIPAGCSGLARLDRRRAALDRQCHELCDGAVQSLRSRLLPCRAADGHHRRLHARLGGVDRARRVLRLAVPVRRAAGAARPARPRAARAAMEPAGRAGEALVDGQVHRSRSGAGVGDDRRSTQRGPRSEIEPFKTAITTKFTRAWPYVVYAGALLAIGLFSERAYCRFLCPLGGVLAVLDRLHLLNRLKRRPECGSPCHLCERACPVRAIEPTGKIVTAECFQCLDCQVEYYDDKRCPPLVRAAKLRSEAKPDRRQGEQCLKRTRIAGTPMSRADGRRRAVVLAHRRGGCRPAADDRGGARDRAARLSCTAGTATCLAHCRSSRCGTPTPHSRSATILQGAP